MQNETGKKQLRVGVPACYLHERGAVPAQLPY